MDGHGPISRAYHSVYLATIVPVARSLVAQVQNMSDSACVKEIAELNARPCIEHMAVYSVNAPVPSALSIDCFTIFSVQSPPMHYIGFGAARFFKILYSIVSSIMFVGTCHLSNNVRSNFGNVS